MVRTAPRPSHPRVQKNDGVDLSTYSRSKSTKKFGDRILDVNFVLVYRHKMIVFGNVVVLVFLHCICRGKWRGKLDPYGKGVCKREVNNQY